MSLQKHESILETIGETPLVKLQTLSEEFNCEIYAKLEGENPGLSVKDRTVLSMIEQAEEEGHLIPGKTTIVEASSGNTGYSLAMICAIKGYKCIVTIKDKASKEKINMIKAMGAEVVLCPAGAKPKDPESYYEKAKTISETVDHGFYINQNYNLYNQLAHYKTTGPEIWEQTEGKITYLFSPASTGGTISGTGKFLKEQNPNIKVVAADCKGSVLKKFHETAEYDTSLKRKTWLEGVGKDIIPPNVSMDNIDEFILVDDRGSVTNIIELAKTEGIMAGGSAGAAIEALRSKKDELTPNDVAVIIFSDHGSKYLSNFYNTEWQVDNGIECFEKVVKKQTVNKL